MREEQTEQTGEEISISCYLRASSTKNPNHRDNYTTTLMNFLIDWVRAVTEISVGLCSHVSSSESKKKHVYCSCAHECITTRLRELRVDLQGRQAPTCIKILKLCPETNSSFLSYCEVTPLSKSFLVWRASLSLAGLFSFEVARCFN